MVSNLYLKFSELQLLDGDDRPFGNIYGATSSAVLTEFLSPQEIIDLSEEELLAFLAEKAETVSLTYPGRPSFCAKPQETRIVWINACMNR